MAGKVEYKPYVTPPFRVSYPHLAEPSAQQGSDPKFSIRMLWPKDSTDLKPLRDLCAQAARECWGDKIPNSVKRPIKDGDESDYENEAGYWCASARSKYRCGVVGGDLREYSPEEIVDKIYPGCWARAKILVGAGEHSGSKYVHFVLQSVQKIRDDESFVTRRSAANDFDAVDGFEDNGAEGF